MGKTKKPTGLAIKRDGNKFTCSWKCGDSNYSEGQMFGYGIYASDKTAYGARSSISGSTRKKVVTVDLSKYYPNAKKPGLAKIDFDISGKRKPYKKGKKTIVPSMSSIVTQTYNVKKPNTPKITGAALSGDYHHICTFSWSTSATASSNEWLLYTVIESMIIKNCSETNGAKLTWKSNQPGWIHETKGASGSRVIEEDTTRLASGSWTRWFRVKAVGPAGETGWVYSKHVYAQPKMATILQANGVSDGAGGTKIHVKWRSNTSTTNPVDESILEYLIAKPGRGFSCPGGNWDEVDRFKDNSGNAETYKIIADAPGTDECMWVRVNNMHDYEANTTPGTPQLVKYGTLENPTIRNVSAPVSTHIATIEADNESDVVDSFLVVRFVSDSYPAGIDIGVIPEGYTSVSVQCPDWGSESISFEVYVAAGSYKRETRADGIASYSINAKMRSGIVKHGGSVPSAPTDVAAVQTDIPGTIRVSWSTSWRDANSTELSWSDHEDAWESTDEPESYIVKNANAAAWNISGLETGKRWYVCARSINIVGDVETYGAYSLPIEVDLTSSPNIPALELSESVITTTGSVTASWGFSSPDGTLQSYAEVHEVTTEEGQDVYTKIAETETAQFVTISAAELGWTAGEQHTIVVRVTSSAGRRSEWSLPAYLQVAEPIECAITQTSLVERQITEDGQTRTALCLESMPLTVTVDGADTGTVTVIIERAGSYHVERPDETMYDGFDGETIVIVGPTAEGQITIERDMLIGKLDDDATYRLIANTTDDLGQYAETDPENPIVFEVHWTHQAIKPSAIIYANNDDMYTRIKPVAPEGTLEGDTCDIYRLSADRPELIYERAAFGTEYVDPYPAIGEYGGHRIVFRTADGDYITPDAGLAWEDYGLEEGNYISRSMMIIDFANERIELPYNVDLSNRWAKDFQKTDYLGGAQQGDWNPAVTRTGNYTAELWADDEEDEEKILAMRRLADYGGICHIRTPEGSSFAADVQVSEDRRQSSWDVYSYSISVTRVDSEGYDGMTYEEWLRVNPRGQR